MTPAERLVARFQPADLGLADQEALAARLSAYLRLAAFERPDGNASQQYQYALGEALGAQIAQLYREQDKFRREGKLTLERDIVGRIDRLSRERDAALKASEPASGAGYRQRSVSVDVEVGL